jgi:hypothetical protein
LDILGVIENGSESAGWNWNNHYLLLVMWLLHLWPDVAGLVCRYMDRAA